MLKQPTPSAAEIETFYLGCLGPNGDMPSAAVCLIALHGARVCQSPTALDRLGVPTAVCAALSEMLATYGDKRAARAAVAEWMGDAEAAR